MPLMCSLVTYTYTGKNYEAADLKEKACKAQLGKIKTFLKVWLNPHQSKSHICQFLTPDEPLVACLCLPGDRATNGRSLVDHQVQS